MRKRREPTKLDLVMDACNHVLDTVEALGDKATVAEVRRLRNEIEDAAIRFADRVRTRKRDKQRRRAG